MRAYALLVAGLVCSTVLAQTTSWVRAYDRSTDLVMRDDSVAMDLFLDSLGGRSMGDIELGTLHGLLQARWLRHSDHKRQAQEAFDSLAVHAQGWHPWLAWLLYYQSGKNLKSLEIHDRAHAHAELAGRAALRCGMAAEAMEMELLAGEINLEAGHYQQAMKAFSTLLERARIAGDQEVESRTLTALGNLHYYQEHDAQALAYYQEALAVARAMNDRSLVLGAVHNIGAALCYTDGAAAAVTLYRAVLDTAKQLPRSTRADLLTNLASMYSDLDEHAAALLTVDEALVLHAADEDTASMAFALLYKATALWSLGRREQALEQVMRSRRYTRDPDLLARGTRKAAEQLHALGRPEEAYALMTEYATQADSLAKSKYGAAMATAQIRFETAEHERRIEAQHQALELAASENRRRSWQRNSAIAMVAVLVLVVVLLWRLAWARKVRLDQQKQLHHQEVDDLLHQHEIRSMHAMFEGQEKERDRVAKDLHDRVGSMLGTVKMQMEVLEERLDTGEREREDQYRKVYGLLVETVGEVRRISHDMVAGNLARFGLAKALEGLASSVRVNGRLQVELHVFGSEQRLDQAVEITVYRIVQELVANVLKHAAASEVGISITRSPGRLNVMVSDDGRGFDPEASVGGMGLVNVRQRALAIGGHVTVDSTPGKGTTVSMECALIE